MSSTGTVALVPVLVSLGRESDTCSGRDCIRECQKVTRSKVANGPWWNRGRAAACDTENLDRT